MGNNSQGTAKPGWGCFIVVEHSAMGKWMRLWGSMWRVSGERGTGSLARWAAWKRGMEAKRASQGFTRVGDGGLWSGVGRKIGEVA